MARVTVGYAIPDAGIVMFTCDRAFRRKMYTRLNLAYAMGGMPAVKTFLAAQAAGDSASR